ncbi:MAG: hypothetical protein PUC62_00920 [Oscillospiraceae bacterium]|nr:hypothetical protein [Oscillospiraceae bacterium]
MPRSSSISASALMPRLSCSRISALVGGLRPGGAALEVALHADHAAEDRGEQQAQKDRRGIQLPYGVKRGDRCVSPLLMCG